MKKGAELRKRFNPNMQRCAVKLGKLAVSGVQEREKLFTLAKIAVHSGAAIAAALRARGNSRKRI